MSDISTPQPEFDLAAAVMVAGGLLLAGGLTAFALRDPGVRRTAGGMAEDSELLEKLGAHVVKAGRDVVASFIRNGGKDAAAALAKRLLGPGA